MRHCLLIRISLYSVLIFGSCIQGMHTIMQRATSRVLQNRTYVSSGALTVVCGSMCSGKSAELIRIVDRFVIAGFKVVSFKPMIDDRKLLPIDGDATCCIPSRNGHWISCIPVKTATEMIAYCEEHNPEVIAIDEINLFFNQTEEIMQFVVRMIQQQKKLIVSGLDLDFKAEPFEPMPQLLALADHVLKLSAICSVCGQDAFCITQRLIDGQPAHYNDPLIMIGASQYEPRCRACHIIRKD